MTNVKRRRYVDQNVIEQIFIGFFFSLSFVAVLFLLFFNYLSILFRSFDRQDFPFRSVLMTIGLCRKYHSGRWKWRISSRINEIFSFNWILLRYEYHLQWRKILMKMFWRNKWFTYTKMFQFAANETSCVMGEILCNRHEWYITNLKLEQRR